MGVRVFILIGLMVQSFHGSAASSELVACIDDHPPYQHLGKDPYGTHITALEKLAKLLKKRLTFVQSSSFARCVALLESGKIDVIAGLNRTPDREAFTFYAPFKAADDRIVITRNDTFVKEYNDLKGLVIGVPRGTTYFTKFDNDASLTKVEIHNLRTGIELIRLSRIDAVLSSPTMINALYSDINAAQLKTSTIPPDSYDGLTRFGFSKKQQLGLSEEKIIELVKTAYQKGYFADID